MEGISSSVYKTIKFYWRHRAYCRVTIRRRRSRLIMGLGRRSWRLRSAQPVIRLQSSNVDARVNLLTRIKQSSVSDVLVFLSGGKGGLVLGRRADKKRNIDQDHVCSRQSPISHNQGSLNSSELKRKMMLNVHIPELFPLRRCCSERHGFADLRAVNSFRANAAA